MLAGKVNDIAPLINLDESKAIERVNYHFLGAILSAAGFELNIRHWIHLLLASLGVTGDNLIETLLFISIN